MSPLKKLPLMRPVRGLLILGGVALFCSCASIKPYEKEYLLHPAMDDGKVAKLNPTLMPAAAANFEKLSSIGAGGGSATSCPTCGG